MLQNLEKKGIIKKGMTIQLKQSFLIVLAVILLIICMVCIALINIRSDKREIAKENYEYEQYLNKEIFGIDLATVISKTVNSNEKNSIQKDEKGYYKENDENSIKIDLKMTTIDKTYPMEEIYKNNITTFVKNFNYIKFKCTSIEYHKKTGRVSKVIFEELQEDS